MPISYNRDSLQTPQPWRRHQPPVASVPTIGNLSGNDFGNISGNKIGKNGNAVRLLTITRAAATVTQSPEKISPRANHLTSTTAPAISPATIPAKIGNNIGKRSATPLAVHYPLRAGGGRASDGRSEKPQSRASGYFYHRSPRTTQKRKKDD